MSDRRSRPGAGLRDLRSDDPTRVGPYELEAKIGEGGMGAVYLGRAPGGQLVAVKVVRPELAEDRAFLSRFNDEMANAERVASFCTAQVLDHGEDLGMAYMVTEYIDGPSLLQHIQEDGPLSPGLLHGVSVGVAAALVAIHSAGLVHRDLKPSNVLLSISGPRVIDFGIARALDAATSHTKTGQVVGTPGYIAPEQVLTQQISPAVDVFAWGCLVAYAANGRNPFGTGSFQIMVGRALHAEPELGALTDPLASLVRAALHKEPERRPSARELLLSLVGGTGGEAEITTQLGEAFAAPPEPESPRPSPAATAGSQPPPARPPGPPPAAEHWANAADVTEAKEALPGANGAPPAPSPSWRGGPEHTNPAGETVTDPGMRQRSPLPPPGPMPAMPPGPTPAMPSAPMPAMPHAAEAPTEPPATRPVSEQPRTRAERPKRRGLVVAGAAVLTLVAATGAGATLWIMQSGDKKPGGDSAAGPAPLPTAAMYVRIDTKKGWPGKCHGDIGRFTPGSGKVETLVGGPQCDMLPERSPVGDKVAFTRRTAGGHEAWIMNGDGSGRQRLSTELAGGRLTWSPDGTRLAGMGEYDGRKQIVIMNVKDGTTRQLTTDGSEKDDPMWSPKSDTIVFWSKRDGDQAIYTLNVNDPGTWTKLSEDRIRTNDPEWSPDGTKIAYTRGEYPNSDIWVMSSDGAQDSRVTKGSEHEMDPNWSRDGKWLAYVSGPYSVPRIRAVRLDGTGDVAVTGDRDIGHPNW
ncbi:protein kinase [Actinomadura fulvescens]|uniref:Protein kinase domain-containing protein n=1 Tax=Actinomadura fulvescens TaxID=46160 RepID=A0ABN3Q0I2_9ACTN